MTSATRHTALDGYSRNIGRVGALAVALGVGMAVTAYPSPAWATPDADSSVDSAASTTDATDAADTQATKDNTPAETPTDTTPDTDTPAVSTPSSTSSESIHTNPVAPEVVIRSSGGALTSEKYSDDPPTTVPQQTEPATAPPNETPESDSAKATTPAHSGSSPSAPGTPQVPPAPRTVNVQRTAALDTPTAPVPLSATVARTLIVAPDQVEPQQNTTRIGVVDAVAPTPKPQPSDPISALLTIPATIVDTATKLVAAAFTQLLAPTPGNPADPPLLWAVLAFVRRQFVNETPTVSPTVSEPDALGNIKITLSETDRDGDRLFYSATDGTKGTVALNSDGHSFTYTPGAGQIGTDTLTITANDSANPHIHGLAGLVNALTFGILGDAGHDSATTTVSVKLNTPPTLTATPSTPDQATGKVTVTVVARDPDGNPLTLAVTQPLGDSGTVSAPTLVDAATGTYTVVYTPDDEARHIAAADTATAAQKADTFTVSVDDGHGGKLTGTVDVTIAGDNDNPEFSTITSSTDAAGKVTGTVVFTDPNKDPVTYSGTATTTKGSVVVNTDGSFAYTPTSSARFVAAATDGDDVDIFTVTVKDGHGGIVQKTITVTITPASITSDGKAALAAAESVIDTKVAAYQSRTTSALQSLATLAPTLDDDQLTALLGTITTQMRALDVAKDAGKAQAAADALAAIEDELGPLTEEKLDDLKAKFVAIQDASRELPKPITVAADARAVVAGQAAGDGKPVFARVDYAVDPDGSVIGRLIFIDPENQPLVIQGGSIISPVPSPGSVAIGAFAHLPPDFFRYTPSGFGAAAQEVTFLVFVGDPDNHITGAAVTIDVTKSSPPPATLTDAATEVTKAQADLDAAIAERVRAGDIQQAQASAETLIKEALARFDAALASVNKIVGT